MSGPARKPLPAPQRRAAEEHAGLALGLLAALRRSSAPRLLDRLLAGRVWIAFVAFALIGIVTLQLLLLTLNGGIGRSLEREARLQRENAAMSIEDSELAAGERVEARAARLGMQLVAPGALRFLAANGHGASASAAAAALTSPVHATEPISSTTSASSEAGSSSSSETGGEEAQGGGEHVAETATAETESGSSAAASTAGAATAASTEASAPASAEAGASTAASSEAAPAGGTQASPAG